MRILVALLFPGVIVAQTATITGVVRSKAGSPLAQAEVTVPGLKLSSQTDSTGRYRISGIAAGRHTVVARSLGFAPDTASVVVAVDETRQNDFTLEPSVQELTAVDVKAREVKNGKLADFEYRRQHGMGRYWTQQEFDKYPARRLTDFLVSAPTVRLWRGRGLAQYVAAGRGSTCLSRVYMDGVVVYSGLRGEIPFDITLIEPSTLAGVEFYPGGSAVPAQYNTTGSSCGVLLLWTR